MSQRRSWMTAMLAVSALAFVWPGCEKPTYSPPTGVDLPLGVCGHGLYVITTDYQSSSVAVITYEGEVAAASVLSSASEDVALSAPLSGDVIAPLERTRFGEILLIDRYPASVLTFFDPRLASVERQVSVQTGFGSNPQDVLEIDESTLWVTRYEKNGNPGREPFDQGSDIVVVNRDDGVIVSRIDLVPALSGMSDDILPRPGRMASLANGRVAVLLAAYSRSFLEQANGRLALVDPSSGAIESVIELPDGTGCSSLAVSPSRERLAVGCSGTFAGTSTPTLEDSAVFVVDVDSKGQPSVASRIGAPELGGDPIGFSLAFAAENGLLVTTFGRLDSKGDLVRADRLVWIELEGPNAGASVDVLASEKTPFTFGDVRCEAQCGVCFLADADRNVVHRIAIDGGAVGEIEAIRIDDGIGLPPRYLGAY